MMFLPTHVSEIQLEYRVTLFYFLETMRFILMCLFIFVSRPSWLLS